MFVVAVQNRCYVANAAFNAIAFVEDILIDGQFHKMSEHFDTTNYQEHSPHYTDDLTALRAALKKVNNSDKVSIEYVKCHRLLAEGNFVLSVSEGFSNETPTSYFDLYRLDKGKIVEHWGTTEAIPSKDKWKNNNGKF